jgi:uncharacterized membrane protein
MDVTDGMGKGHNMNSQQYGHPPDGQPYSPSQPRANVLRWGPSSLGIDPAIGAGLSYLPLVGLIFFFAEKSNRFIRFHAAQSILLAIALLAAGMMRWVVFAVLDSFSSLTAFFFEQGLVCVFGLIGLAFLGLWIWGLVSGFTGTYTRLPLLGAIAESWAGRPA